MTTTTYTVKSIEPKRAFNSKRIEGVWVVVRTLSDNTINGVNYTMDRGIDHVVELIRFDSLQLAKSKAVKEAIERLNAKYPDARMSTF
jgi:hypothetical protein